jgi:hypothetical protein
MRDAGERRDKFNLPLSESSVNGDAVCFAEVAACRIPSNAMVRRKHVLYEAWTILPPLWTILLLFFLQTKKFKLPTFQVILSGHEYTTQKNNSSELSVADWQ